MKHSSSKKKATIFENESSQQKVPAHKPEALGRAYMKQQNFADTSYRLEDNLTAIDSLLSLHHKPDSDNGSNEPVATPRSTVHTNQPHAVNIHVENNSNNNQNQPITKRQAATIAENQLSAGKDRIDSKASRSATKERNESAPFGKTSLSNAPTVFNLSAASHANNSVVIFRASNIDDSVIVHSASNLPQETFPSNITANTASFPFSSHQNSPFQLPQVTLCQLGDSSIPARSNVFQQVEHKHIKHGQRLFMFTNPGSVAASGTKWGVPQDVLGQDGNLSHLPQPFDWTLEVPVFQSSDLNRSTWSGLPQKRPGISPLYGSYLVDEMVTNTQLCQQIEIAAPNLLLEHSPSLRANIDSGCEHSPRLILQILPASAQRGHDFWYLAEVGQTQAAEKSNDASSSISAANVANHRAVTVLGEESIPSVRDNSISRVASSLYRSSSTLQEAIHFTENTVGHKEAFQSEAGVCQVNMDSYSTGAESKSFGSESQRKFQDNFYSMEEVKMFKSDAYPSKHASLENANMAKVSKSATKRKIPASAPKTPTARRRKRKPDLQQSKWDDMLSRLKNFKKIHHHTRVPDSHSDSKLVHWVANQRKAMSRHKRGLLFGRFDQDRIDKLEAIGFQWGQARALKPGSYEHQTWDDMFEKLQNFKMIHDHTRVAASSNERLANWVRNQRTAMSRMKRGLSFCCLNESRILKLESIGFAWLASKDGRPEDEDESNNTNSSLSANSR